MTITASLLSEWGEDSRLARRCNICPASCVALRLLSHIFLDGEILTVLFDLLLRWLAEDAASHFSSTSCFVSSGRGGKVLKSSGGYCLWSSLVLSTTATGTYPMAASMEQPSNPARAGTPVCSQGEATPVGLCRIIPSRLVVAGSPPNRVT
jgi:hypothetical protein